MAECENCIHQYVCEKRTCAECVGGYCDECEIYCEYDGKPDIENCEDFINANDVVPVVRCKNCKHMHCYIDYYTKEKSYNCLKYDALNFVDGDHYCAYGERNDDDGNL